MDQLRWLPLSLAILRLSVDTSVTRPYATVVKYRPNAWGALAALVGLLFSRYTQTLSSNIRASSNNFLLVSFVEIWPHGAELWPKNEKLMTKKATTMWAYYFVPDLNSILLSLLFYQGSISKIPSKYASNPPKLFPCWFSLFWPLLRRQSESSLLWGIRIRNQKQE